MDDLEIAELRKIMERHVDDWIAGDLGPKPTPKDLAAFAQQLEEIADSYGGDPVRYFRADIAWEKLSKPLSEQGKRHRRNG